MKKQQQIVALTSLGKNMDKTQRMLVKQPFMFQHVQHSIVVFGYSKFISNRKRVKMGQYFNLSSTLKKEKETGLIDVLAEFFS